MREIDEVTRVIHRRMLREAEMEGGPGSGPQGGGGGQKWVPKPGGGVMRDKVGKGKPGKYKPAAAKARQQRMRAERGGSRSNPAPGPQQFFGNWNRTP